jgi:hypothetical protein
VSAVTYSLDELPFANIETADNDTRASLLDTTMIDTTPVREENIPEAHDLILPERVEFSLKAEEDIRVLLADRFGSTKTSTFSGIWFITDPFSSFFSEGDIGSFLASPGIGEDDAKSYRLEKKIDRLRWGVMSSILPGTNIRTSTWLLISLSVLSLDALSPTKLSKAKAKYEKKMKKSRNAKKILEKASPEGFEFGIPGVHLIFSKPVKLEIATINMTDGMIVDIMTMHAGDADFHTGGLSLRADATCDSFGNTSIPWSEAVVKNGKITFYTCGASSFTMNPTGGTAGSNDLRAIIGDCAQIQLYYNNLTQIYTGNPPATGCTGAPSVWPTLRIGATTYGNTFTAWTSATTTGATSGNTYTATSTMRATVWGLNYDLIINWSHTAPNKYLTWSWRVIVPTGNTQNVRFYYGMDSFVAGADANDVGYFTNTGWQTIGIYDNVANVLSGFRYVSGSLWTAYQANGYNTVRTQIANGADFTNAIQGTAWDLGFGVNWNFGTTPATYSGTVEWRLAPYVPWAVPDLIPGIWQPEWPLAVGALSQLPITVSNIGNASSTGVHTMVLTLPTNVSGPTSAFVDNGWSCGAQAGTTVTCTKTMSVTAPTGVDTFRVPVLPAAAASGTSVTFNVTLTNASDSNTTNNTAFATNAVVGGAPSLDAWGIAWESLWLQANNSRTNCTTQGCAITIWTNIGWLGTAANGVTGLGTVTYDAATTINGNPTVYFNNASLNTNSNLSITTPAASVFSVTRIGAWGAFLTGPQTAVNNAINWTTTPLYDRFALYNGASFYSGANLRSANIPAITSSIRQAGGASANSTNSLGTLSSATPATAFVSANIWPGRSNTTNSTLTNLAEMIVYPIGLNGTQKNQVESYLAIKYGITLDQTTATNYVLSGAITIWNASLAGVYKNNIAGIARDDISTLNQNRSQSVTNTGDLIVSKSAIGTNRMGLMWANNGTDMTSFTGVDAPTGYQRITREWQFQEKNGDLGSVTISYPVASVPSGFTGTLIMLVDNDGTFASSATAYTGTLSGSNWDFTLNIADMDYVTFSRFVPTDTTPPVITSNSVASGTLAPKGTFPVTITYTDTGSAIVPGSLTWRIYMWDATGATWDVVNIAPAYLTVTSASTSTGVFALAGLPYGKYRFDFLISDSAWNTVTQSATYYIDAIEWTLGAPSYDLGNAPLGSNTFGSGEYLLTVKTVWAAFDLSLLRASDLAYSGQTISVYSAGNGWWYDKNIGSGYSSTITSHGTTQTIVTVAKNINTNGQKNTFTYRVKFGVNPSANTVAGDYVGDVRWGINLTY